MRKPGFPGGTILAAAAIGAATLLAVVVPTAPAQAAPAPAAAPVAQHPTVNTCPTTVAAGSATCFALRRTDVGGHKGLFAANAAGPTGYGPSDLQSAYRLPSATAGAGETVAIVDAFGDPNAEADLQVYRAQYGLPACDTADGCFRKVAQDGSTNYPAPDTGWATEESLDLDMVSAACPNCHILLVQADDNTIANLGAAVNEAVALGAKYVSNSYGGAEGPSETAWDTAYFNHPGVVVTASAGDNGWFAGVSYPAASQYVTAVGGTTLTPDATASRGWDETTWAGTGSGCSSYEPKPSWQTDAGCARRTLNDVSADANPNTGVAVYDTFDAGGWAEYGGTSVSSPVIASIYALAATPVTGSHPSSYPYADSSALNDVTSGRNGVCTPSYLCTAGPGYDGPTGLGTPTGTAAFTSGPQGDIAGTVTSATTGNPLPGATVSVGTASTTTNSSGGYDLTLPTGGYTVTASDFGYTSQSTASVAVGTGQISAENYSLSAQQTVRLSGKVTDGSGEGWPLYAKVGVPGTATSTYTNPKTGSYTLTVPQDAAFTVAADPVYPGYQQAQQSVQTGTGNLTQDFAAQVNPQACSAPGYAFSNQGSTQTFDASTAPPGWSVVNASGTTGGWQFDDPVGLANYTGGSGNFAVGYTASGTAENTRLVSPVVDLSQDSTPVLQFDSDLNGWFGDTENVDVSIDGGQAWTTVWQSLGFPGKRGPGLEKIALPMAAGQPDVQIRFVYRSNGGLWWEIDNVFIGNQTCVPQPGGLVEGTVVDANTGRGLDRATVAGVSNPGQTATTGAAPAHGFYVLYSPDTGSRQFSAADSSYVTATHTATVTAGAVTDLRFWLRAGRLAVTPGAVTATVAQGAAATEQLTFQNTGDAPVTVQLNQDPGGTAPAAQSPHATDPPLQQIKGTFSPAPPARSPARPHGPALPPSRSAVPMQPTVQPSDAPWTDLAAYPVAIMGNAAATDPATGLVYSVGGLGQGPATGQQGYVYQPSTRQWTALPNMQYARFGPAAAFINGKLYVAGGIDPNNTLIQQMEIFDPASGTWSAGASIPRPLTEAAVAVLGGKMYVIGGCDEVTCGYTDVQVYDPSSDTWSSVAGYPEPISQEGCGAIGGRIYCAGGAPDNTTAVSDAFSYDPGSNTWSAIAPLPASLWGMEYASANGELLVSGGVDNLVSSITNQGWAYNPALNSWAALPNSNHAEYGGSGACGFYLVTGYGPESNSVGTTTYIEQDWVQKLPGYGTCGAVSVPWLSESESSFTLNPGQQITVTVTLNAGDPSITGPGAYTAALQASADTPYEPAPIDVTMNVT